MHDGGAGACMTALATNHATASARPATAISALPQMVGSQPLPPPLPLELRGSDPAASRRPEAERFSTTRAAGLRAARPSRLLLRLRRPPPPLGISASPSLPAPPSTFRLP